MVLCLERSNIGYEVLERVSPTEGSRRGKVATIVDVARAAEVSKSTVSLVLGGSPLVADETRERVHRAMSALGYVYNRGAANLRGAPSTSLGMIINDLSNPFFVELAVGIERSSQLGAFVPFLANTAENPIRQSQVIRSMREHGAAGFIISPAIGSSAQVINALTAGLPVVSVIRRLPGLRASLVASQNREGARDAVRHLIGLGHKRIAFAGGMPMVVRDERLAGYRDALDEAGLPYDERIVAASMPTASGGREICARIVGDARPPSAALCFNDAVAVGLMRGLADEGRVVGRDFGVVGFDDIPDARHMSPALTTVDVDARHLGERAAQLLLRQIASGDDTPETQLYGTRLVVRASCGAHREN